ncbi:MAG: alpha/beta hydrolase-fold protein [Pseudomonadota bacterium]
MKKNHCSAGDSAHAFAARATLATATALAALATTPASANPPFVDVAGASIVSQAQLTARTVALTIATPSFAGNTVVEVTLPDGYEAEPARNWPVTYYLAGTNQNAATFRSVYHGETLTAAYPSIIVSPNGAAGYWSDWFNTGTGGPPKYETFVSSQLIPLIDANFRTIASRAHRAIMGESMGGYGVMMMAARHPDLFVAAASLSGGVDSNYVPGTLLLTLSPAIMMAAPDSIYGARFNQEVRWRGHNPADLASNLRDVRLQVRTGNGAFNAANGETLADLVGCVLESALILPESISLHYTLDTLGIAHTWQQYGWGCHSVALFGQEVSDSLPGFVAAFGTPPPSSFNFRSIEPAFSIHGWKVAADPARALEFLSLANVSSQGLTVAGSGATAITTPALFGAWQQVSVVIDGEATTVAATPAGQISFTVSLGTANTQQQYRLGSNTAVATAQVSFVPL